MSTVSSPPIVTPSRAASLRPLLFDEAMSTYAVLDGAAVPGFPGRLRGAVEEHACLYRGALAPDLAERAPYLVKLRRDSILTEWLLGEQWGRSAGIFVVTPTGIEALRRHFRGFLRVRGPDGEVLYFRWYDPRVLRVYLPTCNATEIKTVYGPVARYICESDTGEEAIAFPHHHYRIRLEHHPLSLA